MQFAAILAIVAAAQAAYMPSEAWSTLTPSAAPAGATDYASTFGIAIETIGSANATLVKRNVASQIGDGQLQGTTGTVDDVSTVVSSSAAAVVSQISDGQAQADTATTAAAAVVSQISDGQAQATTGTAAAVVSQIDDGQVQATTKTAAAVVSQIDDGQVQATTKTAAAVVSQISDGQAQATTGSSADAEETVDAASQISDGQAQAATGSSSADSAEETGSDSDDSVSTVACYSEGDLALNLEGSILYDAKGRIGSIVANRQFQFDGPPPQAGAIYAAGWSVTDDEYLAIGDNDVFYQCLSGTFYNLYDEDIGSVCYAVHLKVVNLKNC